MDKNFQGRVIFAGDVSGRALVYKDGLNVLDSYLDSRRALVNKIVCLPQTIGSTTGGMILQTMIREGTAPIALLFSNKIDPLAAAGVTLARIWNQKTLISIDQLGDSFLQEVSNGNEIEITSSGLISIRS